MQPADRGARRVDWAVALALLSATLAYLYVWPRDFYWYDEGLFLYEAKRIRDGAVIYRDFFEIVTPAAWYLMALAFGVLGTTIDTARLVMALGHGATVVLLYAGSRAVGVRRTLAVAAAIGYLALCHPSLPNASPHWFSTAGCMLLFLVLLERPWAGRARGALAPGLIAGTLFMIQQQRAVALAAGAALVLLLDHLIDRRYRRVASPLLPRLLWFAAGIAAISVPAMVALVLVVGVDPLVKALIEFPLVQYPRYHSNMVWGYYLPWIAPIYGRPELIKQLYLVLPIPLIRAAVLWHQRADADRLGVLLTELVVAGAAMVSVAYNPNYTHLTFIAPLFLVPAVELAEWALSFVPREPAWWRAAGAGVAAAFPLIAAAEAWRDLEQRREVFTASYPTAFGRVDFRDERTARLLGTLSQILPPPPKRELFCYPACAGLYLMSDTVNPTPFQILIPRYSAPEHIEQALAILEARKVPYVVILPLWVRWSKDPVVAYVREHYRRIGLGGDVAPAIALFERKRDSQPQP